MSRGSLVRRLALASLVAIAAIGCVPSSEHPVGGGPGVPDAVAQEFLGNWSLRSLGGEPVTGRMDVSITRAANGSFVVTVSDARQTRTTTAAMSQVAGVVVASIQSESGLWTLCAVSFDPSREELTLRTLETSVLRGHVDQGAVRGRIAKGLGGQDLVQLEARPDELHAFLEATPRAFSLTPAVVLVRRQGA